MGVANVVGVGVYLVGSVSQNGVHCGSQAVDGSTVGEAMSIRSPVWGRLKNDARNASRPARGDTGCAVPESGPLAVGIVFADDVDGGHVQIEAD